MTPGDIGRARQGGVGNLLDEVPVDTDYRFGLWHRDRATLRGFYVEGRVALKAALARGHGPDTKFLIVGRARSGTTLLRSLLNAHPDVTCEGEVLHSAVASPRRYLVNLARKAVTAAWGAKLLSYQMVQVHRVRNPRSFLSDLVERDFQLIHIERRTFEQTFSLLAAQSTGRFHTRSKDGGGQAASHRGDPDDFVARLRWSARLLDYEREALNGLPFTHVDYGRDLAAADAVSPTMARLFRGLGVPPAPVRTDLRKTLPPSPWAVIENADEVARAVAAAGMADLLPPR